ncbi:MAG TPA: class I SAM-dependent methyltransferase [Gemmatimonadaceae bacterium]|jgi:SAM-dependent methyltransferase
MPPQPPHNTFTYDSVADRYARMVDTAPYNAFYERPGMLAVVDALPSIRGRRVLDAGCGTGWYAGQLIERGAVVTGVDRSRQMLGYARARLADSPVLLANVDLSVGLPFHTSQFDIVISPLVMHYIEDWTTALRELGRVLVRGGRFIFSTHHPSHEAQRLAADGFPVRYEEVQAVEEEWSDIGHVKFFRRSLTRITGALADAGFVIERLVEPVPTPEFRAVKPESYQRLLERPEFLIVQARLNT